VDQVLYDVLLALHVLCALVGFASVGITGVYGFGAAGPDPTGERQAETVRYFGSPGRIELTLLAVPFLGAAALAVEPHGGGVAQLWAGLAAAVWLVAASLLLGLVRPSQRRVRAGLARNDPIAADARRIGWASVGTDVCFAVALALMIFQPR
jgi:hypothetical protein